MLAFKEAKNGGGGGWTSKAHGKRIRREQVLPPFPSLATVLCLSIAGCLTC